MGELLQFAILTRTMFDAPLLSPEALLCALFQARRRLNFVVIERDSSKEERRVAAPLTMWLHDLNFCNCNPVFREQQ